MKSRERQTLRQTAANYMGYAERIKFKALALNLIYTEYYKNRKRNPISDSSVSVSNNL
jgi:hypothetical protein